MLEDPAGYFPALSVRRALELIDVPEERDDYVEWLEERQQQVFDLWHQCPELQIWLPSARSGRTFERVVPTVRAMLAKHDLEWTDSLSVMPLESQRAAIWCMLSGEGAVPRRGGGTVELVARRLRDQGLKDYGALYDAIKSVFESASQAGRRLA